MDSLSNLTPLTSYPAAPSSSASAQPTGNAPRGTSKSGSTGNNQKTKADFDVATGSDNSDAPLQDANQQEEASHAAGHNMNTSLGQSLGANQDLIDSRDAGSTKSMDDAQASSSSDTPEIADTGLSTDQQITAQQKFQGHQNSDTGSGDHSGKNAEIPSVALADAPLESMKTGTTHSKNIVGLNFSLKVDTSVLNTATSDIETRESSNVVDTNGAPAIPPAPNVFEMIEECTQLSTNLQENTTISMIAANQGMSETLATDYTNQITSIQNSINAQNSANNKSSSLKTFSWVVNVSMVVVGVATADPMLIGAGVAGCIIAADPQITAGLTSSLEELGIPPAAANIMSSLIIVAAASIGCMGIGAAAEMAGGAVEVASQAAVEASEASAEGVTEDAASLSSAGATNTTRIATALRTPEGRAAFVKSLQDSFTAGARSALQSIADTPADAMQSISDSVTSTGKGIYNAGTSIYSTGAYIMTAFSDPLGTLTACYQLASKVSTQCKSLGSVGLPENFVLSMGNEALAQIKAVFSNLSTLDPVRIVHITADLAMAALTGTGSIMEYDASKLQAMAERAQAAVLNSQAATTGISQQIQLSNTQIQMVLNDMNSSIVSAAQTLSTMGDLSAETLGNLRGAAA